MPRYKLVFLVFAFGFMLGLAFGMVAGMWQKEQNEIEEFKKKFNL